MSETVKLTVQLQSHDNRKRFTVHDDVPLSQASARAESIARNLSNVMQREKREKEAAKAANA